MILDKDAISLIRAAFKNGESERAIQVLRTAVAPDSPFVTQARAAKLLSSAVGVPNRSRALRIALVSSSTIDHFKDVLRYWLFMAGIQAELYVAPFDMMVQTVLQEDSELYVFKPDIVWLFTTARDVRINIKPGGTVSEIRTAVSQEVARFASLWQPLLSRLNCMVIQNNGDIPAVDAFGNIGGAAGCGNRSVLRLFNYELASQAPNGVVIFDLDQLSSIFGKGRWIDARYWFHSKHAFNLDAAGFVAHAASQLISASKGLAKKCIILDLDNTLWGGVVGDDGLEGIHLGTGADGEAYVAFQVFLKALRDRGIILAVCSKNEESNAKEPFEKHPDMRLRLNDIAVFKANWNDKVENIREIARLLNIGFDSLVFVDDNPVEREFVRRVLPEVEVLELPDDPALYVEALHAPRYFESTSFSHEDKERARFYRENAERASLEHSFKNTSEYLMSLEMVGSIGSMDTFHMPRIAQLINKSNQFHLTGTRYSEADLIALGQRPEIKVRFFKLQDRFGDNGLISVVILQKDNHVLHVNTWVMSCRVLGRSMEEFIGDEIVRLAVENDCDTIQGIYVPSPKNRLVSELYGRLGFDFLREDGGGGRRGGAEYPIMSRLSHT